MVKKEANNCKIILYKLPIYKIMYANIMLVRQTDVKAIIAER